MIPTLAQVCTLNAPFELDVEEYAAGQCRSIEIWLGKLETYLQSHSVDDVRNLLAQHSVQAPVASFQGGLLDSQGEARRVSWEHFEKRLALLQQLNIQTLVVAGDISTASTQQDLDRIQMSLRQAAEAAERHGVRIALEFQSSARIPNNLQTAASMVADVGHPALGLCFDLYHFYIGPSKLEDLGYLSAENLFHVQLCDLAGVPRELATDGDRVLPGDGDFLIEPIVKHLQEIKYAGPVSIELMNPQIWQVSPRSFGEIAMTALRKVLGQASME
ncbi:MAG: sugar phosphate isomerase/epimerase [Planctomycetota bacterium]|nr:sugar phosphate isomerase/epimerase [Planctomycetota bacterium]